MVVDLEARFQYMNDHEFNLALMNQPNSAQKSKAIREEMELADLLQIFLVEDLIQVLITSKSIGQKLDAIEKLSEWINPTHKLQIAELKQIYIHEPNKAIRNSIRDLLDALFY